MKTLRCPIGSWKNIFFRANHFHKMKKSVWCVKASRSAFILAFLSWIGSVRYPSCGAVFLVQQSAFVPTVNNCTRITFHANPETVCLWYEVHPTFMWPSCLLAPHSSVRTDTNSFAFSEQREAMQHYQDVSLLIYSHLGCCQIDRFCSEEMSALHPWYSLFLREEKSSSWIYFFFPDSTQIDFIYKTL